jgi:hypothetical protein
MYNNPEAGVYVADLNAINLTASPTISFLTSHGLGLTEISLSPQLADPALLLPCARLPLSACCRILKLSIHSQPHLFFVLACSSSNLTRTIARSLSIPLQTRQPLRARELTAR